MGLRYQEEIDKRSLSIKCPFSDNRPDNIRSFRWVIDPIDHQDNFIPNVLFNERKGIPSFPIGSSAQDICLRCGISLMDSIESAKRIWGKLAPRTRKNLGYTHIAEGFIKEDDGLVIIEDIKHFTFYENESEEFLLKKNSK
jgi:hypothetical protein